TSLMADVQRRQYNANAASKRLTVRARRRRVLTVLIGLAVVTLGVAWWRNSLTWLLVHLAVDVLLALYVAVLVQIRQAHRYRTAAGSLPTRQAERKESQVRVTARWAPGARPAVHRRYPGGARRPLPRPGSSSPPRP